MAGQKKQTGRRTTIYRLVGLGDLESAVRPKYLKDDRFEARPVQVGERTGLLVTGAMTKDRVDWCSPVAALTGAEININSVTPAGVLLLPCSSGGTHEDGVGYALTYGMGFQLLEPARLDNLFGQRIAIRTADPDKLRSLTVTTMDERSRTSRATIPQGDGLLGFGVGDVGEAVSRIVAIANLPELSQSVGESLQLRGADALSVPIGLTAGDVLADLDVLERLLAAEPPPALKILEQLSAVKNPERREQLDARLSEVLDGTTDGTVGLAWPHERVDENGTPDSWKPMRLWPGGGNAARQGQPEWADIESALAEEPPGLRLVRVDRAAIQLCRDAYGQDPVSQAIPLRRWIAFECELEGRAYALYDGSWYQIHHDYAENINDRTRTIFDQGVDLAFPPWEADDDEEAYNKKLADALGGVCLDRLLITTDLHPRGFEACDVYLPDGTLIHVKKTERSTAASHLLAQALVSADALCNDVQARDKVRVRVTELGGDSSALESKPARVVLAMHRRQGKAVTAGELFTFTKVNLVRQATSLEARSVKVRIVSIDSAGF